MTVPELRKILKQAPNLINGKMVYPGFFPNDMSGKLTGLHIDTIDENMAKKYMDESSVREGLMAQTNTGVYAPAVLFEKVPLKNILSSFKKDHENGYLDQLIGKNQVQFKVTMHGKTKEISQNIEAFLEDIERSEHEIEEILVNVVNSEEGRIALYANKMANHIIVMYSDVETLNDMAGHLFLDG